MKTEKKYTLKVSIISGPMTDNFIERNPEISRTVEILASQSLGKLHDIIFEAFDREDEHLYEFQFGRRPQDLDGERYTLPLEMSDPFGMSEPAGDATRKTLSSLNLKVGQVFYYWFDFGDDWWHKIEVAAIDDNPPKRKYPVVIKQVGKSPPQYCKIF